jgi:hypothetical protein
MGRLAYVSSHSPVAAFASEIESALQDALLSPPRRVHAHIRHLADAYTLFAFLRETTDVQRVFREVFANGDIWLDTTVILPLFAEQLLDDSERRYSTLLSAATEAGLELWITEGVLEEVERHMNRALTCARQRSDVTWQGRIPFLYTAYIWSGRSKASFAAWLENFRGAARPEDDIADFLAEVFSVGVKSFDSELASAPPDLRYEVQEIWRGKHEIRRRGEGSAFDPLSQAETLAVHDTENFLGVIMRRRTETRQPYGYTSWWLTIDRDASAVVRELADRLGRSAPASPVMSPDFLINYLSLAPIRSRVRAHWILSCRSCWTLAA